MKIKTVKKLNLHELIKHVWENDIENTDFFSNEKIPSGQNVKLHVNPRDFNYGESGKKAGVSLKSHGFVVDDRYTFTVEVEEDLTEHTYFKHLMEVTKDNLFEERLGMTIEGAIRPNTSALYIIEGGVFHLIWSRESGIPESVVLEVDAE